MQKIYGNIQGIKASQIKQLQQLYKQNQSADRLITPEFAQALLIATDSEVKEAFLTYLFPDPESPWVILPPLSLDDLTEQEFDQLVHESERKIADTGDGIFLSQEVVFDQDRVLLVGVQTKVDQVDSETLVRNAIAATN